MAEEGLDQEREIMQQAKKKYREKYEANARQVMIEVLDKGLLDLEGIGSLADALNAMDTSDTRCGCIKNCGCDSKCGDPRIDNYLGDPEYMRAWVIKYVSQELQKQR